VTITVTFPTFAALLAVRVKTLDEVAGFGVKEAVTSLGSPEAASVTLPENPCTGVMVIVLVPLAPPLAMATAFGERRARNLAHGRKCIDQSASVRTAPAVDKS